MDGEEANRELIESTLRSGEIHSRAREMVCMIGNRSTHGDTVEGAVCPISVPSRATSTAACSTGSGRSTRARSLRDGGRARTLVLDREARAGMSSLRLAAVMALSNFGADRLIERALSRVREAGSSKRVLELALSHARRRNAPPQCVAARDAGRGDGAAGAGPTSVRE